MATANKHVPSQTTNASKSYDIVGGTTAPNALGDKYASLAPTSCTNKSTRAQETAPAEVVDDLKPSKGLTSAPPLKPCQPSLPSFPGSLPSSTPRQPGLVLPGGFPLPTPRQPSLVPGNLPPKTPCQSHPFLSRTPPQTDATVTKAHAPSPESASASAKRNGEPETPNVPDAKSTGETSSQTKAFFAAARDSGVKPDEAAAEPVPRPSLHSEADGWGPTITKGGDANPEGPMKPLRPDYIREVSTASTMSASGPGTPADELPAVTRDSREGRWLVSRTGERKWFPNDSLGDLQHIFALLTTGWRYA
ncbi:hypothetical protein EDB89DRAFT_319964 [Lactarius sanguifluus]|nr:hypothetical protein EDB89DRAFT_319964 [Lactarius sanguifluus]